MKFQKRGIYRKKTTGCLWLKGLTAKWNVGWDDRDVLELDRAHGFTTL